MRYYFMRALLFSRDLSPTEFRNSESEGKLCVDLVANTVPHNLFPLTDKHILC